MEDNSKLSPAELVEITKLAEGINIFTQYYDPYEYCDTVDDVEANTSKIANDICHGRTSRLKAMLEEIVKEDDDMPEFSKWAKSLLYRLNKQEQNKAPVR